MRTICARNTLPFRRVENLSVIHLGERKIVLNQAGTAIWELLDGCRSNDEIARVLHSNGSGSEPVTLLRERIGRFLKILVQTGVAVALDPMPAEVLLDSQLSNSRGTAEEERHRDSPRPTGELATEESPGTGCKTRSVEERLRQLYWSKCYIEKMHLELTYRCNCRCVQCYNTTHGGADTELTLQEWAAILGQLAEMYCHTITFTGGEVFARRDVLDIFSAACCAGFSFQINTNGSLIGSSILHCMESMRPFVRSFDISFFGATSPIHDALTRQSGSYDATMRAVTLLKEGNWPLIAKFITMKDNCEGVTQWKSEMAKLGVRHFVAPGILIPRTNRMFLQ